jgi:hypothetical protein
MASASAIRNLRSKWQPLPQSSPTTGEGAPIQNCHVLSPQSLVPSICSGSPDQTYSSALKAMFAELKGVFSVVPGCAGGHTPNPTYTQVCSGKTGHAAVISIQFDPSQITS